MYFLLIQFCAVQIVLKKTTATTFCLKLLFIHFRKILLRDFIRNENDFISGKNMQLRTFRLIKCLHHILNANYYEFFLVLILILLELHKLKNAKGYYE